MERGYLEAEQVHTIYFGGGTPSLLPTQDVAGLLETIRKNFPVSPTAEVTLEANPDDINPEKLAEWKAAGINRLSLGIQSFYEEELRWMNRAHTAEQSMQCIRWCQEAGLHNLSIDLIYGSPLLSDDMWEQNVRTALSLNIPHLSCYALTVEEKTPLDKQIRTSKKQPVDADRQASQFLLLMDWLRKAGYEHYEVSNFAKPGFRSRHNSSYWKGDQYLGIGPSAHSFNGKERRWNVANNQVYVAGIETGAPKREAEQLTATQKLDEYIMISLRTMEGMSLTRVEADFGSEERRRIEHQLKRYEGNGLVHVAGEHAVLTDEGMLRADGIASDLFA
jgi:oxygen-independent coproporphyrinogen-3 oxidase